MFNIILTKILKSMGYALETIEEALEFAKVAKNSDRPYPGNIVRIRGGYTPLAKREDPGIIFNYVGEHTEDLKQIYQSFSHYCNLNSIGDISIKQSQFGAFHYLLINRLAEAMPEGRTLWIDAEEYSKHHAQLALACELVKKSYQSTGLTIQLKSDHCIEDARICFEQGIKVRLCKGAYPKRISKFEIRRRADEIVHMYKEVSKKHCCVLNIATIRDVYFVMLAVEFKLPLQVLYGWHRKFLDYPYKLTIYVPFGTNWWPYLRRRIKEKIGRGN